MTGSAPLSPLRIRCSQMPRVLAERVGDQLGLAGRQIRPRLVACSLRVRWNRHCCRCAGAPAPGAGFGGCQWSALRAAVGGARSVCPRRFRCPGGWSRPWSSGPPRTRCRTPRPGRRRPAAPGRAPRSGRRPGTRRSGYARPPGRRCRGSASRRMRSSTSAVWVTPSAAVGSSMITSLASCITALATATACRCPPDSEPTGWRMLRTVVTRRSLEGLPWRSSPWSPRPAADAAGSRGRAACSATMSRLSQSARSW